MKLRDALLGECADKVEEVETEVKRKKELAPFSSRPALVGQEAPISEEKGTKRTNKKLDENGGERRNKTKDQISPGTSNIWLSC